MNGIDRIQVKVYGTSEVAKGEAPNRHVLKQIAVVLAVCALALTVCVALISTSELRPRSVALYGIGSGEEDDADQATTVTFETFDGQDEWMEELLGDEYYVDLFAEIAESEPITEAIDEVTVAVDEAKNEHEVLQAFAEGEER